MKKYLLIFVAMFALTGCGYLERLGGTVTGGGFESCVDGVLYMQFTSGVTVKYRPDGKIATCK